MRTRRSAGLLLALVGACGPAAAQSPSPAVAPPPEIVVSGRTNATSEALTRQLTSHLRHAQIARWNDPVCSEIEGVEPTRAAFLKARIDQVAATLAVPVDRKRRCVPNIVVVLTDQADDLIKRLIRDTPWAFSQMEGPALAADPARDLLVARPVRWLTLEETGHADGSPRDAPVYFPSRIRAKTRQNVELSYLVVDVTRLAGHTWGQLADFLAMVTFSHPALTDRFGSETILGIFDGGPADGLTGADWAYLKGLYHSDVAMTGNQQRGAIRREGARQTRPDAAQRSISRTGD